MINSAEFRRLSSHQIFRFRSFVLTGRAVFWRLWDCLTFAEISLQKEDGKDYSARALED